MTRIIIVVSGGVVQEVLSNQDAEIILVDYDNLTEDFDGSLEEKYNYFLNESKTKQLMIKTVMDLRESDSLSGTIFSTRLYKKKRVKPNN